MYFLKSFYYKYIYFNINFNYLFLFPYSSAFFAPIYFHKRIYFCIFFFFTSSHLHFQAASRGVVPVLRWQNHSTKKQTGRNISTSGKVLFAVSSHYRRCLKAHILPWGHTHRLTNWKLYHPLFWVLSFKLLSQALCCPLLATGCRWRNRATRLKTGRNKAWDST